MHFGEDNATIFFGANGYLGFEISRYLNKRDIHVYEIDRKLAKIQALRESLPISKDKTFRALIVAAGPDRSQCNRNYDDAKSDNEELIKSVRYIANNFKIEKLIFLSSIHIYGATPKGFISESTKPDPYDKYSELKLENEFRFSELANIFEMSIYHVRVSNVFGFSATKKTAWKSLVLNYLFLSAIKGYQIKLNKDKAAYRNFIYIEKLTEFFEFLISFKEDQHLVNQVINLGGKTLFLEEVASIVKEFRDFGFLKNLAFWEKKLVREERPFCYYSSFVKLHKNLSNNILEDFESNYAKLKRLYVQNIVK